MKNIKLMTVVAIVAMLTFVVLPSTTFAQAGNCTNENFVDVNGDGFNDNAPDADGDGIPNGQDEDYIRGTDGTGSKNGNGQGNGAGNGSGAGQGGGIGFIDEDGDGFNDNAPDADGDGIPNGQDPDWVADGNGPHGQGRGQRGAGAVECTEDGDVTSGSLRRLNSVKLNSARVSNTK